VFRRYNRVSKVSGAVVTRSYSRLFVSAESVPIHAVLLLFTRVFTTAFHLSYFASIILSVNSLWVIYDTDNVNAAPINMATVLWGNNCLLISASYHGQAMVAGNPSVCSPANSLVTSEPMYPKEDSIV